MNWTEDQFDFDLDEIDMLEALNDDYQANPEISEDYSVTVAY